MGKKGHSFLVALTALWCTLASAAACLPGLRALFGVGSLTDRWKRPGLYTAAPLVAKPQRDLTRRLQALPDAPLPPEVEKALQSFPRRKPETPAEWQALGKAVREALQRQGIRVQPVEGDPNTLWVIPAASIDALAKKPFATVLASQGARGGPLGGTRYVFRLASLVERRHTYSRPKRELVLHLGSSFSRTGTTSDVHELGHRNRHLQLLRAVGEAERRRRLEQPRPGELIRLSSSKGRPRVYRVLSVGGKGQVTLVERAPANAATRVLGARELESSGAVPLKEESGREVPLLPRDPSVPISFKLRADAPELRFSSALGEKIYGGASGHHLEEADMYFEEWDLMRRRIESTLTRAEAAATSPGALSVPELSRFLDEIEVARRESLHATNRATSIVSLGEHDVRILDRAMKSRATPQLVHEAPGEPTYLTLSGTGWEIRFVRQEVESPGETLSDPELMARVMTEIRAARDHLVDLGRQMKDDVRQGRAARERRLTLAAAALSKELESRKGP